MKTLGEVKMEFIVVFAGKLPCHRDNEQLPIASSALEVLLPIMNSAIFYNLL
jgi:hypothetical protein